MNSKTPQKGPLTEAWFKNFSFVIKQGNLLWGLPFSFNQFSKSMYITKRKKFHFKCLVTFFTCWIVIYLSNYIHVIYWRSKDQMNLYAFCFCITFVDLIIYILASIVFLDMHHFCRGFNAILDYGRDFNCKACASLANKLTTQRGYN
jgi:hypothetical protein